MNTQITSAEEILKAAQKILLEHGASALNMRAVAAACGVSVGSIYNYFPSKSALIGATIESVWTEIFRPFTSRCYTSFDDAATALLAALADGEGRYPGFFRCTRFPSPAATKPKDARAWRSISAPCTENWWKRWKTTRASAPAFSTATCRAGALRAT